VRKLNYLYKRIPEQCSYFFVFTDYSKCGTIFIRLTVATLLTFSLNEFSIKYEVQSVKTGFSLIKLNDFFIICKTCNILTWKSEFFEHS